MNEHVVSVTPESPHLATYTMKTPEVDYDHPAVRLKISELREVCAGLEDYAKKAYEFVRDHIAHSWDIQSARITCAASEALLAGEGICYAKSNLLCALLRGNGIPAGFCYQRLTLGDTPDTGYCIHALNGVYIDSAAKWIRLDARGNKPGVQAEFSLHQEKLAFPVRSELGEREYSTVYAEPNSRTIAVLKQHTNSIDMYLHGLPDEL